MGEVWKARDTRLDRGVAIKVLPAEFAQNAQLKARFEREAKTISQLNHPNICTLFDVGDDYLVMELLEGESLADRVARGPLPLRDVLRHGVEIAEALDKAHRAGVVHRDLKPGNVMITKSGAKLLDFGLAKSNALSISADGETQQKPLTQEGTILGTFQYMAPEQLEGMDADARSDIFALGAVLYEMATGQRAFSGKTKTSLIAAIVKESPRPIAELQPLTPPALQHVVDKCLAKDPDERWQSAQDIASELKWISAAGSQAGVAAPVASARARNRRLVTAAAIVGWVIAVAAVVTISMLASRLRSARRLTSTQIETSVMDAQEGPLSVSADGLRIVAVVQAGATSKLWLRELTKDQGQLLAGTEGANYPFWAPDGHAIGFFAEGKLKTITIETAAIQTLCDAPYGRGGSWSPEGVIVFAPNIATPLFKVSENGGTPVAVTNAPEKTTHRNPMMLPDGKHFLYSVGNSVGVDSSLHVGSIEGGFDRKVLDYASTAAFVNGWLLTVRDHNLVAQRFDPGSMKVSGKRIALAQSVDWFDGRYTGAFAAAENILVYQHAAEPKRQILHLDKEVVSPAKTGDIAYYALPSISPDGSRIIVNRYDPRTYGGDLWMYEVGTANGVRLTFTSRQGMNDSAAFSADGQRIAVGSAASSGNSRCWIQPVGGGTREQLLENTPASYVQMTDWSRDGRTLLIGPQREKTGQDIEMLRLDGDRKPVPLIHGSTDEGNATFSPNEKWIAYDSNETGRTEVYVTNFPSASGKWQVSNNGGRRPYWSADGRQLFYLAGDRVVVSAVNDGDSFSAGPAQPLESLGEHIVDLAVSRSGRIVAIRELDPGKPPLTVVMNWDQLLKRSE